MKHAVIIQIRDLPDADRDGLLSVINGLVF
jgi:hypothetical protein